MRGNYGQNLKNEDLPVTDARQLRAKFKNRCFARNGGQVARLAASWHFEKQGYLRSCFGLSSAFYKIVKKVDKIARKVTINVSNT